MSERNERATPATRWNPAAPTTTRLTAEAAIARDGLIAISAVVDPASWRPGTRPPGGTGGADRDRRRVGAASPPCSTSSAGWMSSVVPAAAGTIC
ncbi:MAG: hypothetical protein U0232_03545 [Thermomicrobiales bacterium]